MEKLWSPWRADYILGEKDEGCFLCRAASGDRDRENLVLYRSDRSFVVMNRYPYNPGHLMVAPFVHEGKLGALRDRDLADLFELVRHAVVVLEEAVSPDGINVGMNLGQVAGAGVLDHLHVHLVPRWNGDTNFMPVCAETKVISQALEEAYEMLVKYFTK